jgi:superfamily II DNA or RNA helicase
MRALPSGKDQDGWQPREGQREVENWVKQYVDDDLLTVRFPGGYGKTIAVLMAYGARRQQGICNRLLFVVANDTQVRQLQRDLLDDCAQVGLDICGIWKFTNDGTTVRANLEGRAEIFIMNIQSVSATNRKEVDTLLQLLRVGSGKMRWMLAADEYHHYATEQDWGQSLNRLREFCTFTIATSATPDRNGNPTIFGDPKIVVQYEDGVREKALKAPRVHMRDGTITRYTTDDLRNKQLDGGLSRFEEKQVLRYSAKYYHPLVTHPVSRLLSLRDLTGRPLQMLIKAMSCLHAAMLCEQIKELAPSLVVEWVGTGLSGRPTIENERIIEAFCPRKVRGKRPAPQVDILVQVAMAGEGLDCINVTEVIDLSLSTAEGGSTQLKQFLLRGSRWIAGLLERYQILHINLPSDHPLARLMDPERQHQNIDDVDELDLGEGFAEANAIGGNSVDAGITNWIEGGEPLPPPRHGDDNESDDTPYVVPAPRAGDYEFLFVSPRRRDIELTSVRDDDPHFKDFVNRAKEWFAATTVDDFDVTDPRHLDKAKQWYVGVRGSIAGQQDEQARISFLRDRVNRLVQNTARLALLSKAGNRPLERSEIGAMNKRLNTALIEIVGKRDDLFPEELAQVWEIVVQWDGDIRAGRPPLWAR